MSDHSTEALQQKERALREQFERQTAEAQAVLAAGTAVDRDLTALRTRIDTVNTAKPEATDQPVKVTLADMQRMTPAQMREALEAGRLPHHDLPPAAGTHQLSRADLAAMSPEDVVAAHDAGRCRDLVNTENK